MGSFFHFLPYCIILLTSLAACGGAGNKPGVYPSVGIGLAGVDLETAPADGWSPEKIELECNSKNGCPKQVGLLIFVFPESGGKIPFTKCTAFLSSPDQITSNGHCDRTGSGATGYFITAGPDKQVRRVTRAVFKRYTPGERQGRESGRPDVGVYQLDQPVHAFAPLAYATAASPIYEKLIGYGINNGRDPGHYLIDEVRCLIRRHESIFPYDLSENPDVVTAFQCGTNRGNSGGPAFAPGSAEVQGVLQATSDRERKRIVVREKLRRDLLRHEEHDSITMTNLRCINAAAGVCIAADRAQSQARFTALQTRAAEALTKRTPPASATDGVRFKAVAFQTATGSDLKFEIFHQPVCLEGKARPQKISVPLEYVELAFNEWAAPQPVVLETRIAEFTLKPSAGARVEIRAEWPDQFAELTNSAQHPRRAWGRSFSIDLPPCPR